MIMIGKQTVADSPLISWPLNGQACIWWQTILLPCLNYILLMQLDVRLLDNVVILQPDMN